MTPDTRDDVVPPRIAELLSERGTLLQWLERLEERREDVRPAVYERVRSDYGERLERVERSLAGHRSDLEESLARHRSTVAELEAEHEDRDARLEEMELRHAVGELEEEEFEQVAEELRAELEDLEGRLAEERSASERLEEVLEELGRMEGLEELEPAPEPEAERTGAAGPASGAAGEPSTGDDVEGGRRRPETEGSGEPRDEEPEEEDELDFLESLAWEEEGLDTLSLVLDEDEEEESREDDG